MTETKKKVSEKSLLNRINRKLKGSSERINKTRKNSHWLSTLGYYYHVDLRAHTIVGKEINLEAFAKDEGVLKNSEELIWD